MLRGRPLERVEAALRKTMTKLGIRPSPLFSADDDWLYSFLRSTRDPHPPYRVYPANHNWITTAGNPFSGAGRAAAHARLRGPR